MAFEIIKLTHLLTYYFTR